MSAAAAAGGSAGIRIKDLAAPERRAIHGWCMYDWANSGFATSGTVAILPVYFVYLFRESFGPSTEFLGITWTGSSVWGLAVAFSTAVVLFSSPVLGVVSDRVPIKKLLLWIYVGAGSLFTALAFFCAYAGQPWAWLVGTFTIANIGFAGSQVFYNAFLPHLAPRQLADAVSSRGYAYGYAGGGLLLVIHLGMILATQGSPIEDLITRISIASIAVWWFGWSLWTFATLPEPPIVNRPASLSVLGATRTAFAELGMTFRQLRRFRVVLIFLVSFLLFNDGVQTITAIAGAFAADTLKIPLVFNMGTILIIQFVAVPGALAFGWIADRLATKTALAIALVGWIVIVLFGVALAPLAPRDHQDYDVRIEFDAGTNRYLVAAAPESEGEGSDLGAPLATGLAAGQTIDPTMVPAILAEAGAAADYEYSISIAGGPASGTATLGGGHPAAFGDGPVDFWPGLVRDLIWAPLGIEAGYQWLILGILVGCVLGGSQALARSLFSQITPRSRSGEFFAFFGFMSRASAVFGPTLYIAATAAFDTRVAVTSILLIIVLGTILLRFVDVAEGTRVAIAHDAAGQHD